MEEIENFDEWKKDKKWIDGFALRVRRTQLVSVAFNFYRSKDTDTLFVLRSCPHYIRNPKKPTQKKPVKIMRRCEVSIEVAVDSYRVGELRYRSTILDKCPEFKQVYALEML